MANQFGKFAPLPLPCLVILFFRFKQARSILQLVYLYNISFMENKSNDKLKIAVAITGASGSIYAQTLLKKLAVYSDQIDTVSLVMSNNAKDVWKLELQNESYNDFDFKLYDKYDFFAPFASGSANYSALIVCPCSMGTLGRIAAGTSDDLTTRAADVMLKEKKN